MSRPGFQREEDKIKRVANKINKLFDRPVTFDYSYKFEPVSRENYATILSGSHTVQEVFWDFGRAGFL